MCGFSLGWLTSLYLELKFVGKLKHAVFKSYIRVGKRKRKHGKLFQSSFSPEEHVMSYICQKSREGYIKYLCNKREGAMNFIISESDGCDVTCCAILLLSTAYLLKLLLRPITILENKSDCIRMLTPVCLSLHISLKS